VRRERWPRGSSRRLILLENRIAGFLAESRSAFRPQNRPTLARPRGATARGTRRSTSREFEVSHGSSGLSTVATTQLSVATSSIATGWRNGVFLPRRQAEIPASRELSYITRRIGVPSRGRSGASVRETTYVNATPLWRSHVKFERSTRRQRVDSTACRFFRPSPLLLLHRPLSSGNVARWGSGVSKVQIFRDRTWPIRCRCRARRRFLSKVESPAGQYHF